MEYKMASSIIAFSNLVISLAIGGAALVIARAQMKIAERKLNHDLFDKRYAIYVACRKQIDDVLSFKMNSESSKEFFRNTLSVYFLLDQSFISFVKEINDRSKKDIVGFGKIDNKFGTKSREELELMAPGHANFLWFFKEGGNLEKRFQNSLRIA